MPELVISFNRTSGGLSAEAEAAVFVTCSLYLRMTSLRFWTPAVILASRGTGVNNLATGISAAGSFAS